MAKNKKTKKTKRKIPFGFSKFKLLPLISPNITWRPEFGEMKIHPNCTFTKPGTWKFDDTKKGESWRKGYQKGISEATKAFGGCTKCYGKGYGTKTEWAVAARERFSKKLFSISYCKCDRGKQLIKIIEEVVNISVDVSVDKCYEKHASK